MAPNSNKANRWPGRVGTVVSTSKNAISDLSSPLLELIAFVFLNCTDFHNCMCTYACLYRIRFQEREREREGF